MLNLLRISLFLLVAFVTSLDGQKTEKFQFAKLGTLEGLSQGRVTAILHDRSGFMWFGTADGLNRFDGYSFITFRFNRSDSRSIRNNVINDIKELPDGRLIVAHNLGLDIFDPVRQTFSHLPFHESDQTGQELRVVSTVLIPSNFTGYFYIGTHEGLIKYHLGSNKHSTILPLMADPTRNEKSVRTLYEDKNGRLWIGTGGEGLYFLDLKTNSAVRIFIPETSRFTSKIHGVTHITTDGNDRIFISELMAIHVFDLTGRKIRTISSPGGQLIPVGISGFGDGKILISYLDHGLFIYSYETDSFTRLIDRASAQGDVIPDLISIYRDRDSTYWGGTNGYGVVSFKPGGPVLKKVNDFGSKMKSIRSMVELADGSIMLSGYNGFVRFSKGMGEIISHSNKAHSPYGNYLVAFSMIEDIFEPGKSVWMGSEGNGLFRYNVGTGEIIRIGRAKTGQDVIRGDYVYSLHWGSDSLLWLVTEFGLHSLDTRKNVTNYYHPMIGKNSISSFGVVFSLIEYGNDLFLCTERHGLVRFDRKTGAYSIFLDSRTIPISIPSNDTRSLHINRDGIFYIGTSSGLSVFNPTKKAVTDYSTVNGLPGDLIYGILEDGEGNIWISTNAGIARINPKTGLFSGFTLADGLQGYEFNSKAYLKLKDGTLMFGGTEGVNLINPEVVNRKEKLPSILITGVSLFSRKLPVGEFNGKVILDSAEHLKKSIILDHSENSITIEFTAFEPGIRYTYRLEGLDAHYSPPTPERRAVYNNLAPGEYTFRVSTLDREGNPAGNEAVLQLVILPPFWQTWWFRGILAMLLAAILIGGYYRKVNAIRKRNIELESLVDQRTIQLELKKKELEERNAELQEIDSSKNSFISMLAHDIRSPFSAILGYLQIVTEDYDDLSDDEKKSFLKSVNSVSKGLYSTIDNVLHWFRIEMGRVHFDPEYLMIEDLTKEVSDVLSGNLYEKKIELITEIEHGTKIFADRIMMKTVLQNLIANAIKFSQENDVISVAGDKKGDNYQISISDSGSGMTGEEIAKLFRKETILVKEGTRKEKGTGLGLLICKEYIEINGGDISVKSIPGEGTSFTFTVPLKKEDRQG